MAAHTVTLNVLKTLLSCIETQATEEVSLLWNFKNDLKDMETTLTMLEAVLDDAARLSDQNKAVSVWLAELRSACYDIQDMLDPYLLNYRSGVLGKVRQSFTLIKLTHKMRSMRQRLNRIAERKSMFNLKENVGLDLSNINRERETFSSLSYDYAVLGRDKEQNQIVELIQSNKDNEKIFVLPIYGIGGLGKTTLAKIIFNCSELRGSKHFDAWAWAYVSLEFDLSDIGRRIITSIRDSECNTQNLEVISKELQKEVTGKRCLIVLDDAWNVEMEQWENLKTMLKDSSKGSTILMTTRSEKIAIDIATNVAPFSLNTLSDETCMLLFQQRAFKSPDDMPKYPKLIAIGKEIVKKCGGVALAANVLGSMLRARMDEKLWLDVKNNEIWGLTDNNLATLSSGENKILSTLKLSYNLLSPELKPCLLIALSFLKAIE